MRKHPKTKGNTRVTLLRLGIGKREHILSEGGSLAELLRLEGVVAEDQEVLIDGRPLAEHVFLKPGAIVSVMPRVREKSRNGDPLDQWRGVIGAFHDNPEFDAMMRQVMVEREAEKEKP